MREILFRGKRIDTGEWIEGLLLKLKDEEYGEIYAIVSVNCESYRFGISGDYVITDTIGQYTGLEDKNGVKIFEGDIVSFERVNALGYTTKRTGDVRYYDKLPIFYIMATTGDAWDWCCCDNITVIGNIHDNPELLEVTP